MQYNRYNNSINGKSQKSDLPRSVAEHIKAQREYVKNNYVRIILNERKPGVGNRLDLGLFGRNGLPGIGNV